MLLIFFLGLVFANEGCSERIECLGANCTSDFTWANGVSNLTFQFELDCATHTSCRVDWWLDADRLSSATGTTLCNTFEDFVKLDCLKTGDILQTNMSINQPFTAGSMLAVRISGVADATEQPIKIQNCTRMSEGIIEANLTDPDVSCGLGCKANASCNDDFSPDFIIAECMFDVTWKMGKDCIQITTTTPAPTSATDTTEQSEPSASPTAATPPVDNYVIKCDNRAGNCTVAVGTADVKFTFIYRCPENTCIVVWELEYDGYSSNSTVNVTSGAADCSVTPAEYSITCDVVDEVITTTITIAKLDANVTLSVYSDANLRRVIENNGLELIDRKDITVIYCPDFGKAEVDAESVTCPYNQYNCTFTFSCNDDDKKVVSTCQANATWSVMPDSVCSGDCLLYWLVSLIAFLIDVPIILLLVISCKESCSCACCPSESDLRIILIGSIAAAGVSFTGTLVGAFVCETAGRIVTLVFGCTSLAWELPTGIYYLVVYVCEKKTK